MNDYPKRTRLSLGPRQIERLLLAIRYAEDAVGPDEGDDEEPGGWNARELREYEALRTTIYKGVVVARRKAREL